MRIAICDDEATHRDSLREHLLASGLLQEGAEIFEYKSGNELVDGHDGRPHHIIFLDIEMDGISGLEAGQEIRRKDRNAIIIFLTSFKDYVFKSFQIEPFDYIVKPIEKKKIDDAMGRAIRKYKEQHYIIDIKFQEEAFALKVCDIIYLESELRHIKFYADDNMYKCIGKLNDYERRLLPYGFLRCHQSFLINMSYIKSINDKIIRTTSGVEVLMTYRRKQECLSAFADFITKYKV